jgi:hypothetical protein
LSESSFFLSKNDDSDKCRKFFGRVWGTLFYKKGAPNLTALKALWYEPIRGTKRESLDTGRGGIETDANAHGMPIGVLRLTYPIQKPRPGERPGLGGASLPALWFPTNVRLPQVNWTFNHWKDCVRRET